MDRRPLGKIGRLAFPAGFCYNGAILGGEPCGDQRTIPDGSCLFLSRPAKRSRPIRRPVQGHGRGVSPSPGQGTKDPDQLLPAAPVCRRIPAHPQAKGLAGPLHRFDPGPARSVGFPPDRHGGRALSRPLDPSHPH